MAFPRIRYLDWASRNFDLNPPRFNLAASGLSATTAEELGLHDGPPLTLSGPGAHGHPRLVAAIAERHGVTRDRVLCATGTTQANFLVQAALLGPGDEVLCEAPAYEPLWRTVTTFGARLAWLPREAERRFVPDLGRIADAMARGTKLVQLSDLHNPSATLLPRDFIAELGRLAARHDAWVLVDEVYLSGPLDTPQPSAATFNDRLIATGSLTKSYGLGQLRAGWVLAPAPLVVRMREILTHVGSVRPWLADEVAARAFDRIEQLHRKASHRRDENLARVQGALASVPGLVLHPSDGAFIAWAKLPPGVQATPFVEHLQRTEETLVVPGDFFGASDHVRLGFGLDPAMVSEGLDRLVRGLRTFAESDGIR
jgi:aspartate/methionine/tyrosine aminotransferase